MQRLCRPRQRTFHERIESPVSQGVKDNGAPEESQLAVGSDQSLFDHPIRARICFRSARTDDSVPRGIDGPIAIASRCSSNQTKKEDSSAPERRWWFNHGWKAPTWAS